MISSRKEQWILFYCLNGLLVFTILFFPIYQKYLMTLPSNKCHMVELLHLYCPACGGTRAFMALCKLDILSALKYNPIVPLGAALFLLLDFSVTRNLIIKKETGPTIKPWHVYAVLVFWFLIFIVRNVLLRFGIDTLGNLLH